MNPDFVEAAVNDRYTVLGYSLEPFSAAHLLALEAAGAECLKGPTVDPLDIVGTLRICASKVSEKTMLPKAMEGTNGLRELAVLFAMRMKPALLWRASREIQAYLADHCASPVISTSNSTQGDDFEGDETLSRVQGGMKAGLSEFRAWSMPLGLLDWHNAQAAFSRGAKIKIKNADHDREIMAHLNAL